MSQHVGFRLPRILLPRAGVDLHKWAVIACDQYTAEPAYWRRVEAEVGSAPSALRLIFPETHLGEPDAPARITAIHEAMRRYLDDHLLEPQDGAVYVERTVGGRTRRGLMLEVDLEHYDYGVSSNSLVRPTEGTIVERLAPRIEVRRDAALELPHILVLIDDPEGTVIEPLAAARDRLRAKVRYRPVGFELLPAKFTLARLQGMYEALLERDLDKRNFRKRVLEMGVLADTGEVEEGVRHRPARLYRFDKARYDRLVRDGFNFEV